MSGKHEREYYRRWREKTREGIRLRMRYWINRNRKKHNGWSSRWYYANREAIKVARSLRVPIAKAREMLGGPGA